MEAQHAARVAEEKMKEIKELWGDDIRQLVGLSKEEVKSKAVHEKNENDSVKSKIVATQVKYIMSSVTARNEATVENNRRIE